MRDATHLHRGGGSLQKRGDILFFFILQDVVFFASCPAAPWPQFGEMLSWQFLSATKRGLNDDQLETIAHRLFGEFRFCFLVFLAVIIF